MVAQFPAIVPVQWESWSPGPEDGLNEVTDVWANPVERKVISWSNRQTIQRDSDHVALELDKVSLQIPTTFGWTVRDRVTLPGRGAYLVTGVDDGMGFHGWRPGISLLLEKS